MTEVYINPPAQGGVYTYTVESYENNTFHSENPEKHQASAIFRSGSVAIDKGMPVVWNALDDGYSIEALRYGQFTALTTKTFTLTSGHEALFKVGDVVYASTRRKDNFEMCGAITAINTTSHTITVTATPSIAYGCIYVNNDSTNVLEASTSADAETNVITLTATGASYKFSIGDFVYETDADDENIKNLGKITAVNHSGNTITVTTAPAQTAGGKVGIIPWLPNIIGVCGRYVDNTLRYQYGTTITGDTSVYFHFAVEVYKHSLGIYSNLQDVHDRMRETCPGVILVPDSLENNGI